MKTETLLKILILFLIPILEVVLSNSQISFLMNLQLVVLIGIFFILIKQYRNSFIYVLSASAVVELLSLQTIGIKALGFYLAAFLVYFLFSLLPLRRSSSDKIVGGIVLVLSILNILFLKTMINNQNFSFSFSVLIANLLLYFFIIYLVNKFTVSHVFKK
ncbi:MAG: hypothetical protein WCJ58_03905 [bacterium]